MTPDDRADTLEEIDEEHADEILSEIPSEARRETEQLLSFEPDTAGGLMTTEFVSVVGRHDGGGCARERAGAWRAREGRRRCTRSTRRTRRAASRA